MFRTADWLGRSPVDAAVVFSPGAATSGSLGFAIDAVDRLGVRLIALDRPGLGTGAGRTLLDMAADLRSLVTKLALERPAIVGFSQGAPFALALVSCRRCRRWHRRA